jgi:tRNA pseudouridine38-40 synthase
MRAHVDIAKVAPFRLMEAINARIRPNPVAVLDCVTVADDSGRAFVHPPGLRISHRQPPRPRPRRAGVAVHQPLDEAAVAEAASRLVGRHDFDLPLGPLPAGQPGPHAGPAVGRARSVHALCRRRSLPASSVRSMVGCLALVGMGRWTPDDVEAALVARDRARWAGRAVGQAVLRRGRLSLGRLTHEARQLDMGGPAELAHRLHHSSCQP